VAIIFSLTIVTVILLCAHLIPLLLAPTLPLIKMLTGVRPDRASDSATKHP
jgi:hypothetical protein